MACVYKLTRSDNLEYIGITNNLKTRLNTHKRSSRFDCGISKVEVLFEGSYSDCDDAEEVFIALFGTYHRGLNVTPHGKGNHVDSSRFNTLGYRFSESSRDKMRKAKENYVPWNKGLTGAFKPSKRWIEKHTFSGSSNGRSVLTEDVVRNIIVDFNSHPAIDGVGDIQKNGKPMSYIWAFCLARAPHYNVTPQAIRRLVERKTWIEVWKEFDC